MFKFTFKFTALILAHLISLSNPASAADAPSNIHLNGPHQGYSGWEVSIGPGVYVAGAELFVGGDTKNDIEPIVMTETTYHGENVYLLLSDTSGFVLGYNLLRGENWATDVVFGPKMSLPKNDELDVLDERRIDFHAGLKMSRYKNKNLLTMEISRDVSNEHNGSLLDIEYLHEFQVRNLVITTGLAGILVSRKMNDHYFGVDANEATAKFPVYRAGASRILFARINFEYPLNENWVVSANLVGGEGDAEIRNSPITKRGYFTGLSAGVRYRF